MKIIWQRRSWEFVEIGECGYQEYMEQDCEGHDFSAHYLPARAMLPEDGYISQYRFEIRRLRPDGKPSEDWSPMNGEEIERVRTQWMRDRFDQLVRNPEVEEVDA